MNKKGITIVELIVSFALTAVIGLFLIQIVLFLRENYMVTGIKNEILSKQSMISNRINNLLDSKNIISINSDCGNNCISIMFDDYSNETISLDKNANKIIVGNYVAKFPNGSQIGDIVLEEYTNINKNIIAIKVQITNSLIKDDVFNLNVIKQYNL